MEAADTGNVYDCGAELHAGNAGAGCIKCAAEVCVDELCEVVFCCVCYKDCGWVYTSAVKEIIEGIDLLSDETGTFCGR